MPRIRRPREIHRYTPLDSRIDDDMKRIELGIGRKVCGDDKCKTQASYGFVRNRGLSCATHVYGHPHTNEPMTNVKSLCTFTEDGVMVCMNSARYGPKGKGGKRISCGIHKDEMAKDHGGGLCDKKARECQTEKCYGGGRYYLASDATNPKKLYLCPACVRYI